MFGVAAFGGIGGGFGLGGVGVGGFGLLGIATSVFHSITTSRECVAVSVQAASLASWPDPVAVRQSKNDFSAIL
jgi:hypothetical protein